MLPPIEHILYLTDLSKHATFVFRYAVQMAKTFHARITILHVIKSIDPAMEVPILVSMGEDAYQKLMKEKEEAIIQGIRARLEKFIEQELADEPEISGLIDSIHVHEGDPVADILESAERFQCDLLVMGDHSKGRLRYTFLGSTAEKVLRRSRRPVLIVPIPEKNEEEDISV